MADEIPALNSADSPNKGPEARLLDLLSRMRNNAASSYGVHLHLSELRASHRQPHFMRMVARSLDRLASQDDVQVFTCANGDIALLCRNTPIDNVDDAVFRVRALFNEDPLTQGDDGSADDQFSSWYDLSQEIDFKGFVDAVQALVLAREASKNQHLSAKSSGRVSKAMQGNPLTPEMLTGIQQKLLEARIADLVHRQSAINVGGGKKQHQIFREHFIAMGDLQKRIAPKVNLFSGHWLFQYLSETLDARVLEVLSRLDYENMECPLSVNLNTSTIMSRPFQNFHSVVASHTDKVIVEIQIIDIFADMPGYVQVRDWLQEHGYRVLIDGLSPLMLNFFDPTLLRADYIKLGWGSEVQGGVDQDKTDHIRASIQSMDKGSVILARVESEEGVSWGLSLGIICFQGHYIDKVVDAMIHKGMI